MVIAVANQLKTLIFNMNQTLNLLRLIPNNNYDLRIILRKSSPNHMFQKITPLYLSNCLARPIRVELPAAKINAKTSGATPSLPFNGHDDFSRMVITHR
jgi:hypothetical protein